MDPNETLRRLRMLFANEGMPDPLEFDDARDLFAGLDDWLSKGGFLPEPWSRKRGTPLHRAAGK